MTPKKSKTGIVWVHDTLTPKLKALPVLAKAGVRAITEYEANNGQNYMRIHAPWTDRTANARQGLFARPFDDDKAFGIVLYHTMPYGIYLETRFSGRYAIIDPSLQVVGKALMQSLENYLKAAA